MAAVDEIVFHQLLAVAPLLRPLHPVGGTALGRAAARRRADRLVGGFFWFADLRRRHALASRLAWGWLPARRRRIPALRRARRPQGAPAAPDPLRRTPGAVRRGLERGRRRCCCWPASLSCGGPGPPAPGPDDGGRAAGARRARAAGPTLVPAVPGRVVGGRLRAGRRPGLAGLGPPTHRLLAGRLRPAGGRRRATGPTPRQPERSHGAAPAARHAGTAGAGARRPGDAAAAGRAAAGTPSGRPAAARPPTAPARPPGHRRAADHRRVGVGAAHPAVRGGRTATRPAPRRAPALPGRRVPLRLVVGRAGPGAASPGLAVRVGALLAASAGHAVLAKYLYAQAETLPPGLTDRDPEAFRSAAQLMYYGGDLAELLLAQPSSPPGTTPAAR